MMNTAEIFISMQAMSTRTSTNEIIDEKIDCILVEFISVTYMILHIAR